MWPAQWIVFVPSRIALWHACMECEKCSNRYLCERGNSGKKLPLSATEYNFSNIQFHLLSSHRQRERNRERLYVCVCVCSIGQFSRGAIGICGTYCVLLLGNVEEIFIQWLEFERIVIFDDDQNRLLFCRIA